MRWECAIKHGHFLLFSGSFCTMCVSTSCCGLISVAGGHVLEGGLRSRSGQMKKRRGNYFYLAHFSVRILWTADSSNPVLFVLAVCLHKFLCTNISSYQNKVSSLLLTYKHNAYRAVGFCASGQQYLALEFRSHL